MAVAMPKILHLPIFGILSALTSCFAFCPFRRPSASFKLRSSARTRRNSFLRVQNRFSCVRQVNRYFSLSTTSLRRAGRLFHTKRSALILRFSLSCSTTLHPKQSPVDPYSDPDSNMVRRFTHQRRLQTPILRGSTQRDDMTGHRIVEKVEGRASPAFISASSTSSEIFRLACVLQTGPVKSWLVSKSSGHPGPLS
jgi:hypothetical protein